MSAASILHRAITAAISLESKIRGGFTILNGEVVQQDVKPEVEITEQLSVQVKQLDDRVDQDRLFTEFINYLPKELYREIVNARL